MPVRADKLKIILLLTAILALGACASYGPYVGQGASTSSGSRTPGSRYPRPANTPVPVAVPGGESTQESPGAIGQPAIVRVPKPAGPAAFLLAEAERYQAEKNYTAAAASIERAMRIEAGNPWLSLALANVRVAQENPGQAETLARRALTRAGNDPELNGQCWEAIAAARLLRGDLGGADQAQRQADQYL